MFLAHTGVALGATSADERVPLLWWLLAAWAFDITGIGHWIPFAVVLAVIAYRKGQRRWGGPAGVALAVAVLSHDLLDLVVGVQLWPTGPYLGWNLEHGSRIELALEVGLLVVGWVLYRSTLPRDTRNEPPVVLAFAALLSTSIAVSAFYRPAEDEMSLSGLLILGTGAILTAVLLVRVDRDARAVSSLRGR